jgi:hypothetical protein
LLQSFSSYGAFRFSPQNKLGFSREKARIESRPSRFLG